MGGGDRAKTGSVPSPPCGEAFLEMEVGGCLPEEKTGGILFPGALGWPPIWASGEWILIAHAFFLSWSHAFILPKEFYFQFLKSLPLLSPKP